jgi:outer membrane protein TolC
VKSFVIGTQNGGNPILEIEDHLPAIVCIYNAAPAIKISCCLSYVPPRFHMHMEYLNPERESSPTKSTARAAVVFCLLGLLPGLALAQIGSGYSSPSSDTTSAPSIQVTSPSDQSPYSGSVAQGTVKPEAVSLTFQDAIDLGLKNNLGVLLQSYNSIAARGRKWKELSELLPNLTARVSENVAQQNLAAEGLRFPGFPTVVGPYGYTDARVYLSQSILNLKALNRDRGAAEDERAAQFSYKDARDLVVLATGNAYLQALSGAARLETAEAQLQTAQALFGKATDQQNAGLSPAIDTLRSQVEFQNRQQQLIVARNDFAKQKLALVRAIGLPVGQEIALISKAPYEAMVTLGIEQSLQQAYASRSDYLAAAQQVRAAEHFRKGASAEYFPTIDVVADYGDLGTNFGNSHGTFTFAGRLNIPIFQGGKVHADVLQSEATLRQARSQLDNLRGQIEYEVRTALLDIEAANQQVQVARSSVDLAEQTLTQARDRFSAGVTDNLEVVEAQQTVASAHESYISSLYAHNLAKLELVRAMGFAEQRVKQYLQGK